MFCCGSRALGTGRRISGSGQLLTSPTVCCWPTLRQTSFYTAPSMSTSDALSDTFSGTVARRCSSCAEIDASKGSDRVALKGVRCWWNQWPSSPSWCELQLLMLTPSSCDVTVATSRESICEYWRSRGLSCIVVTVKSRVNSLWTL